jgi:hypothetical protein
MSPALSNTSCLSEDYRGTKLSVQLFNEMRRRKQKYGMVTMCVGTGHPPPPCCGGRRGAASVPADRQVCLSC